VKWFRLAAEQRKSFSGTPKKVANAPPDDFRQSPQ
jgi:hypothetical protein